MVRLALDQVIHRLAEDRFLEKQPYYEMARVAVHHTAGDLPALPGAALGRGVPVRGELRRQVARLAWALD